MQGARRGTRSRVPRIRPWAEVGAKPLSHPGCPSAIFLKKILREGEREREAEGHSSEADPLLNVEPDMGSILEPQDHDLSQNQESDA